MNKTCLSLLLVVLITFSLVSVGTWRLGKAQTNANVSSIIASDTAWTAANSPYSLSGNVLVNSGVTLTIQSGTTVNLNSYYIRVNGTLVIDPGATLNVGMIGDGIQVNGVLSAVGTSINPILINGAMQGHIFFAAYSAITFSSASPGWNQQSETGSIMENTIVNQTGITINNSLKFSDNTVISGSIVGAGGSPQFTGNTIKSSLSFSGGSPMVADNNLQVVDFYTMVTGELENGNAIVSDNQITGGISIDPGWQYLTVERNMITGCTDGIQIDGSNTQSPNTLIEDNTIISNSVGVLVSVLYAPTITNNNIYNNGYNFKLGQWGPQAESNNIDATNNWWGTTDQQAINQTIYDFKDDFNVGTVNFVPFLTAPNPEATPNPNLPLPTPASTSSPTTSPTQPTFQQSAQPTNPTNTPTPASSQNRHTTPTFSLSPIGVIVLVAVLLAVIATLSVAVVVLLRRKSVN